MTNFGTLSKRQVEALCDMIVALENREQTRIGSFTWTTYTMPLPVHMAFCEWCATQPEAPASAPPPPPQQPSQPPR